MYLSRIEVVEDIKNDALYLDMIENVQITRDKPDEHLIIGLLNVTRTKSKNSVVYNYEVLDYVMRNARLNLTDTSALWLKKKLSAFFVAGNVFVNWSVIVNKEFTTFISNDKKKHLLHSKLLKSKQLKLEL